MTVHTVAVYPRHTHANYATSYGVLANGVNDDTAALQRAIDATPTNGSLLLPAGTMLYTTLSVTRAMSIHGAGYGSTFLKMVADTNGDGLKINVAGGAQINNVEVSDLTFGAANAQTAGAALRVGYVGYFNARNIRITNALGGAPYEGLRIDRASDSHFANFRVAGCAGYGAVLQPGSSSSVIVEVYFDDECEFRTCTLDGMYLLMDQAYSEGVCSLEGIHISGSYYNNTKAGIRVHATVAGASIRNIHLSDVVLDSNQGTSTTVGSYDAGLVLDASFNASAEIRRVVVDLGGGWVSANKSSGIAVLQRSKQVSIVGGIISLNQKHGIDAQNVETLYVDTVFLDNGQATDNTWYAISMGGAGTFHTVNGLIHNTDASSNDQRGANIGSSMTDVDLSGLSITPATDVGTVAKINGGNGASNARIKLPPYGQVVAKTSAYQWDADLGSPDAMVTCDTSGGAFTVTMPRAANYPGRICTVKRTAGANTVTIAATAGSVENTSCTTTPVTHISNGTDWICMTSGT